MADICALGNITEGTTAIIRKVGGEGRLRRRLLEMGFVPGTEVTVVKRAPLRDPWEYRIKGAHVSLRSSEANEIMVEIK